MPMLEEPYTPEKNWRRNFSKLYLWTLIEYAKIIYVDADVTILKNMDHLFLERWPFMAVHNYMGKCCAKPPRFDIEFSGGFMVLTPSNITYDDLMEKMQPLIAHPNGFHEQTFLAGYFRFTMTWLPDHYMGNRAIFTDNPELWDSMGEHYGIHWTVPKPWSWSEDPGGVTWKSGATAAYERDFDLQCSPPEQDRHNV